MSTDQTDNDQAEHHALTHRLHSTNNAGVWAAEFMKTFEGRLGDLDEGTMLGWFANAMYAQKSADSRDQHAAHMAMVTAGDEFSFLVSEGERLTLSAAVHQAVGAASTCWESMENTGVFNDTRALHISQQLLDFIRYHFVEVRRYHAPLNPDGSEPDLPAVGTMLPETNTVVIEVMPDHREVVTVALPLEPAS